MKKHGQGVKGCNCIMCQADRDGTGDTIGAAVCFVLFLLIICLGLLFGAFLIFG